MNQQDKAPAAGPDPEQDAHTNLRALRISTRLRIGTPSVAPTTPPGPAKKSAMTSQTLDEKPHHYTREDF